MPPTPVAFPDLKDFQVVGQNQPVNLKDFKLSDGTPLVGPDGFLIPQARSFATIVNSGTRTYSYRFDEAMRDNWINARAMRRDAFIRGLMEERILPTINREFTVEVDDERDPEQQFVRDGMLRILRSIPNFDVLKRALLDAVWFGRSGVQWTWGRNEEVDNLWSVAKWDPLHGDSVQFTFDGHPAILMDSLTTSWYANHGATYGPEGDLRATDRGGTALVLHRPQWRERFAIHQHILEKADFFEGELAGSVQGLGIRGLVYWQYVLRTDALTWMLAYMQAVGQMDLLVFNYPAGNYAAQRQQEINAQQVIGKAAIACPRNPAQNWPAVEQIPMNEAGLRALQALVADYFDRHIERLIVGQSMSSGQDKGTGLGGTGRAEFARATKDEIIVYDSVRLDQTLTNDLLKPLKRYNFPWAKFPVRFKSVLPDIKAVEKVQAGRALISVGVPIKAQEFREAAGYSNPEPGDETVGAPMAPPGAGPGGPPGAGGGGPPPSWQGAPLMLARGQNPTRYMGMAAPGGANTFIPGFGGTDGPAPRSRGRGETQYAEPQWGEDGFLIQDESAPTEMKVLRADDSISMLRPYRDSAGRIVWRVHRDVGNLHDHPGGLAEAFKDHFDITDWQNMGNDSPEWKRIEMRGNAGRQLTPRELWIATGGAMGEPPPEIDWRPTETMPEDFYGYRRPASPTRYAGNYPRNPELTCLTDLIDRLPDVELQGISVRANAGTREVFIDQQAWANFGTANQLKSAAEQCGYRATIQVGGYVPNGVGWAVLYGRGSPVRYGKKPKDAAGANRFRDRTRDSQQRFRDRRSTADPAANARRIADALKLAGSLNRRQIQKKLGLNAAALDAAAAAGAEQGLFDAHERPGKPDGGGPRTREFRLRDQVGPEQYAAFERRKYTKFTYIPDSGLARVTEWTPLYDDRRGKWIWTEHESHGVVPAEDVRDGGRFAGAAWGHPYGSMLSDAEIEEFTRLEPPQAAESPDWRPDEVMPEDFYAFGRGSPPVAYGWLNAPPGGATLNGRPYRAGQFIPATTMFQHTPGRGGPTPYAPVPGQEPVPGPQPPSDAPMGGMGGPPPVDGPTPPEAGLAVGAGLDVDPRMAGPQPVQTPGLTPEEALVEVQTQMFAWQNYPLLRTAYFTGDPQRGVPGQATLDPVSGDVRTLTLDQASWEPLLPGYTGTNGPAVQAAAAWLNGQLYGESLMNQYGKGNAKVVVVAGTGSLPPDSALQEYYKTAGYPLVIDGGESYPLLAAKLEGARAAGFQPEVTYVDQPPGGQVQESIARSMDARQKGQPARTTPLATAIRKNLSSRRAILELLFRNPDVPVRVIDRRNTERFQRRVITDPRQAAMHLANALQQDEANAGLELAQLRQEILGQHRAGELPVDIITGLLGEGWWVHPPVPPANMMQM